MGISAGLGYYRITDPAMGLCNSSSLDVIMVPGGNTGQSEQHNPSYTKARRYHYNDRLGIWDPGHPCHFWWKHGSHVVAGPEI